MNSTPRGGDVNLLFFQKLYENEKNWTGGRGHAYLAPYESANDFLTFSGVDPGFPLGGSANPPGGTNIPFCQNFRKTWNKLTSVCVWVFYLFIQRITIW